METAFQGLNNGGSDNVKSAERVLSVLEHLGSTDRPVSLADLSLDLAIPKSSALALLRTLQRRGYVVRDEAERYVIAPVFRGGEGDWVGGIPGRLLRAARPVVEDLVARTRETVNLGIMLPGGTVRALLQCPSPQEVRYVPSDTECPAYCTAMGRMLLAHLSAPEVAEILDRGRLAKLTDKTETRPAALKKLVAQARQQGFAEIDGEYAEGGSGAAAPIFDHADKMIAVLNLATLSVRWRRQRDEFIPELVRAAARISGELAKLAPPRAA